MEFLQEEQEGKQIVFKIHWLPFLLNPSAPREGVDRKQYLRSKFGLEDPDKHPMMARMVQEGKKVGINFAFADVLPSPLLAHQLLMHVYENSKDKEYPECNAQDRLHTGIFKRYYELAQDISKENVLKECVAEAKAEAYVSPNFFEENTKPNSTLEKQVRAMDQYAKYEMDVSGVPFFVFNKKFAVSGAQDATVLFNVLKKVLAKK